MPRKGGAIFRSNPVGQHGCKARGQMSWERRGAYIARTRLEHSKRIGGALDCRFKPVEFPVRHSLDKLLECREDLQHGFRARPGARDQPCEASMFLRWSALELALPPAARPGTKTREASPFAQRNGVVVELARVGGGLLTGLDARRHVC